MRPLLLLPIHEQSPVGSADWFPQDHPPMLEIAAHDFELYGSPSFERAPGGPALHMRRMAEEERSKLTRKPVVADIRGRQHLSGKRKIRCPMTIRKSRGGPALRPSRSEMPRRGLHALPGVLK